jgi:hypothetical protein
MDNDLVQQPSAASSARMALILCRLGSSEPVSMPRPCGRTWRRFRVPEPPSRMAGNLLHMGPRRVAIRQGAKTWARVAWYPAEFKTP